MRSASTLTRGTALLLVAALAACSGSGAQRAVPDVAAAPIPVSAGGGMAKVKFTVNWPSSHKATVRHGRAISPSTLSITVSVNNNAPQVVNKPTTSGTPPSTSITIDAPVGTDSFTFTAWDQPGGLGNALDKATISQAIIANTNNTVGVTLDGVCAALLPSITTTSAYLQARSSTIPITAGGSQSVLQSLRIVGPFTAGITVNQIDADGNTILNSAGAIAIDLSESGSVSHVTIAPASTAAGNNKFTLTPLVAEPDGFSTTISATSPNCGPGTTTFPNSFALSTSAVVYVADQVAGITAFDQDGTQVAKIATTTGVTGLAYNSASNSFVAIEPKSTTSGGANFQTLSLTGASLGSGTLPISTSLKNLPGNISYNPVDGYFLVALRENMNTSVYGTVLEFTISGSTAKAVTPTGTDPFLVNSSTGPPPYDPNSFAILPSGNIIVGDTQTDSYEFDKNGNYLSNSTTVAYSFAIDTTRNILLDFSQPTYATLYTIPSLTNTDGCCGYIPNPISGSEATASAYGPGEDEIYAFGAGFAAGVAGSVYYNDSSTVMSNLPANAFAGLSAPSQAVVLP